MDTSGTLALARDIIEGNRGIEGLTYGRYDSKTKTAYMFDPIAIARSTYRSILRLADVIGHELNHAKDYVNGNMTTWIRKSGNEYRSAMSEFNAYQYQKIWGIIFQMCCSRTVF